jgi:hypothetical protein
MFGGIAFMASGHMCCGVVNDTLMAQVNVLCYDLSCHHSGFVRVEKICSLPPHFKKQYLQKNCT